MKYQGHMQCAFDADGGNPAQPTERAETIEGCDCESNDTEIALTLKKYYRVPSTIVRKCVIL